MCIHWNIRVFCVQAEKVIGQKWVFNQYERTVRLLSSRVEESLSDQITCVQDFEILMDTLGNLKMNDKILFNLSGANTKPVAIINSKR